MFKKIINKGLEMTKKITKVEKEEAVAQIAAVEPKEIPVAVIAKRPPHAFTVALNEGGKTVKHEFNSKEAMVTFLASRIL
jgi:hypothetical protein